MKKLLLRTTLCAALIVSPGLPRAWAAPLDSSVVKVICHRALPGGEMK